MKNNYNEGEYGSASISNDSLSMEYYNTYL